MSVQTAISRINLPALKKMKKQKQPIVALTAYDYSFARLLDQSGIDIILVGDSLGMVIQGHQTTIPVSMEDMLYHTSIVSKGVERALLIMDMPFMSYASVERALDNATLALQEAGAQMVKLEGGLDQLPIVEALSRHDIPVCAHIGLKPQSIYKSGSYRVQGRNQSAATLMIEEAGSRDYRQYRYTRDRYRCRQCLRWPDTGTSGFTRHHTGQTTKVFKKLSARKS
jgi:3-methyl-2-oxobutanoate hydroxymethyltransferase